AIPRQDFLENSLRSDLRALLLFDRGKRCERSCLGGEEGCSARRATAAVGVVALPRSGLASVAQLLRRCRNGACKQGRCNCQKNSPRKPHSCPPAGGPVSDYRLAATAGEGPVPEAFIASRPFTCHDFSIIHDLRDVGQQNSRASK